MALFVIEREFADQLELDEDGIEGLLDYNSDNSIRWLFSFLSSDKKKTYCLYEAADPAALQKQASDLDLPADAIVEVSELNPAMFNGVSVSGHLST